MTHKPTPAHTPWEIAGHQEYHELEIFRADEDGNMHTICSFDAREEYALVNAKHIVRCVNSHDALVEALENVTLLLNDPGVGDIDEWKRDCKEWTHNARAALNLAKGE